MNILLVLVMVVAATADGSAVPQPPGYLGLGVSYRKPDPQKGSPGWLLVQHVPADGPAFRAGLKPQTVITAVNGQPLTYPDDASMLRWLKSIRPGQRIRLTVAGAKPREVVLVAAEMPPDKLRIWKANFERSTRGKARRD